MQLFSIQKCIFLASLCILFTNGQTAVVPLPPPNPNPVLNTITNFDWSESASVNQTFSIDIDEPSRVHVTDLNYQGKGFSVYDNDILLGETATVITRDNPYGVDEYNYRQGFFNLDKGKHIIAVQLNDPAEKGTGTISIIPGWNKENITIIPTDNPIVVNNTTASMNNTNSVNSNEMNNNGTSIATTGIVDSEGTDDVNQDQYSGENEEDNNEGESQDKVEDISEEDEGSKEDETEDNNEEDTECEEDSDKEDDHNEDDTADSDETNESSLSNDNIPETNTSVDDISNAPYTVTITSTVIVNVYATKASDLQQSATPIESATV